MTWEILSRSDSKTCLTFWGLNCIECMASDNNIYIKRLLRRLNEVKFMDALAQSSSVSAGCDDDLLMDRVSSLRFPSIRVLWLLSIWVHLLFFPEYSLSPFASIRFPTFSPRCPQNPEEKYKFCLYLFC